MLKDFEIFDNKIIILYILNNSDKPLTIEQIVKFCEDFEDITYFDIFDYVEKLNLSGYIDTVIENDTKLYKINPCGSATLAELLELVPGVNLYNLKKMVSKNMIKVKKEHTINTQILPSKDNTYKVSCYIKDGNDEIINISLFAGSKEEAIKISQNWDKNSDKIYDLILKGLTGDIIDI